MPRNGLAGTIRKTKQRKAEEPGKTIGEISGCVRPELGNKWPNVTIMTMMMMMMIHHHHHHHHHQTDRRGVCYIEKTSTQ
jgi:hypothetical protein